MSSTTYVTVPELGQVPPGPDRESVLQDAAMGLESTIKQNWFDSEGRGRWQQKWIVPGVVKDLDASANIKARRFDLGGGQTGVDTGHMRNTLTVTYDGDGEMTLSTSDYAKKFHEGGPSFIRFTSSAWANLRVWYSKNRTRGRQLVRDHNLGWLFGQAPGSEIRFNQHPRPLFDAELIKQNVRKAVRAWLMDGIKGDVDHD